MPRRRRILSRLLAFLAFGAVVLFALVRLGLHAELDGSGIFPVFSFYKPQAHYAALEKSRVEQQKLAVSAPAPPPAEIPAAAAPVATPAKIISRVPTGFWPAFRGLARDGRYEEPVRTDWPAEGLPLLWRQPVGGGYASFSVARGMAFTIEQRRQNEVVAAYDLDTGREAWTDSWPAFFHEAMGGDGPRATPTWDDGRLYALGATGEFRCFDAQTGKRLWSKNILAENQAENLTWGMAASPLIVGEKVIVVSGKSVIAYHKLTGDPVWKALDEKQAYTSPMLATLGGRPQILTVSAHRVMGLAVEDGALLWEYPWTTEYDVNSAQPLLLGENRFFISAGYGHGATVLEVTKTDPGFAVRAGWSNNRMKNKFSGSVLHQGHIYGLDEAILACMNAETGELKWKGGRYGYGQLLLADGHLVVLTESGDIVLVKATPERHEELARFSALSGKTWNVPALAGGRLLVRNTTQMACYRIAPR